ncbi:MAG: pyridoxal phosphate-dependent aminotransferase [Pseudomonadota bacterium]|jgi:alanine-synthesizing transaminase
MKPPGADVLFSTAKTVGYKEHLIDPNNSDMPNYQLPRALDSLRRLQHARAVEGLPVWDLSMVNPDLSPPRAVLDRLLESVTKTSTHRYAVSRGVRRLREAFSIKYSARFGQQLDPETQVCVCLGSKDATFHALRALLEPGDAVIVPTPAYPAHLSAVSLASGRCVPWVAAENPLQAADELSALIESSAAKVVLLNFPSNPAGSVITREWWLEIGRVCAKHSVTIVNDFVYGEMCFSGEAAESALCVREVGAQCAEVYSLSKAYNVPGWRVGALVGDRDIVEGVARLKSQADYGLFLPLQYAAAQALVSTDDLVAPTVKAYYRRLRVLDSGLADIGWQSVFPGAGACLWTRFPDDFAAHHEGSEYRSVNVARHLLTEAGVVVTPGAVFGPQWDGWVRFAVVTSEERLRDVVTAIRSLG